MLSGQGDPLGGAAPAGPVAVFVAQFLHLTEMMLPASFHHKVSKSMAKIQHQKNSCPLKKCEGRGTVCKSTHISLP